MLYGLAGGVACRLGADPLCHLGMTQSLRLEPAHCWWPRWWNAAILRDCRVHLRREGQDVEVEALEQCIPGLHCEEVDERNGHAHGGNDSRCQVELVRDNGEDTPKYDRQHH